MKLSQLQEHFDNRHDGNSVAAMMKNHCELKEPVWILHQPFQNWLLYLLTNHCYWLIPNGV